MEKREYRTVDKSAWPRGEWDDEPDKMQWPDPATGLPCLIVRNPSGALCGYVGVSEGHACYNLSYNEILSLEVHGRITFSDFCADTDDESKHICHVAGKGEPAKVFWLGFDCAHAYDLSPAYTRMYGIYRIGDQTYRNVEYVQAECAKLAAQLAALGR